ncbi:MAG: hypothetical protein ABIG52_03440 [Nanoarchaeota archaeon]|nr:hypothetical protein [Nanoarchaeota archaeon]MBU1644162.1 hypothetical protein [Nanoarchaeota archaeon]
MDLKELRRECHELASVPELLQEFQNSWIKPIRKNTNRQIPFINKLSEETKTEINRRLALIKKNLEDINRGQIINQKLTHTSRYLIEFKLTTLNGDVNKRKMITNLLLHDDFVKIKNTLIDIKEFEENLKEITKQYNNINKILLKKLKAKDTATFQNLPHKKNLKKLTDLSKKHQVIAEHIGNQFVELLGESKKNR